MLQKGQSISATKVHSQYTFSHRPNLLSFRNCLGVKGDSLFKTLVGMIEDVLHQLARVGDGDIGEVRSLG